MDSVFDLERFVIAQDAGGTYERAVRELRNGHKTSHWMWFVFPQVAGLGTSAASLMYAIPSLDHAQQYLRHPVLGPRLIECAGIVAATAGRSAVAVFGPTDAKKLKSSSTLFFRAAPGEPVFGQVLDVFFAGEVDAATDRLLSAAPA